jgi:hypothetical protein
MGERTAKSTGEGGPVETSKSGNEFLFVLISRFQAEREKTKLLKSPPPVAAERRKKGHQIDTSLYQIGQIPTKGRAISSGRKVDSQ